MNAVRTDAPNAPDARVLALDIGAYGHKGSISAMFWYRAGGLLHAHQSQLLPQEATVRDQMDILEALAESYPEYWRVSPVVVVGVTILSGEGRRDVREHLDSWYNPPARRRLVAIGDYAGEQGGSRGLVPRKKLRDLIAARLTAHTLRMTAEQQNAVALYTGRRQKPAHDADTDGWRHDDTDAVAVPVALSCLAAKTLLPPPEPTAEQQWRARNRMVRAWQFEAGLDEDQAREQAHRHGYPRVFQTSGAEVSFALPEPGVSALNLPLKGA